MTQQWTRFILVAVGMTVAIAARPAVAQNALGDGRALERDLRVGGKGNEPRRSLRKEAEFRNAIVTGNAGGGKSFRGNAGYSSASDFRGRTADDSTFAFRRDSMASSGLSTSVRGADSVQYQYTYSVGNTGTLSRLTGQALGEKGLMTTSAKRQVDTRSQDIGRGALRSPSLFSANRDLRPTLMGYSKSARGIEAVTASPLLGIKYSPEDDAPVKSRAIDTSAAVDSAALARPSYVSTMEPIRRRLETFAGTGVVQVDGRGNFEPAKPATEPKVGPGETSGVQETGGSSAGGESKESPDSQEKSQKPEWQVRLDELSLRLGARSDQTDAQEREKAAAERTARRQAALTTDPQKVDDKPAGETKPTKAADYVPGSWREKERSKQEAEEGKAIGIDERTIELIRRAGGTASTFGFGETSDTEPFQLHMRIGQLLLQNEKYFDAEERFARALTYQPGDEMAQVARIHSQIGAGVHLSAALNLHALFINRPELIGVRYQGGTIPTLPRLKVQADQLRQRVDYSTERGLEPPRDAALLLAYVGFQAYQPEDVRKGLDACLVRADEKERVMVELLRSIWLNPHPDSGQPFEAPAAEPVPAAPSDSK